MGDNLIFFLSEPANFSASNWLRKKFPTVPSCPKKRKKYFEKEKAIRKWHTNFLFRNLKLVLLIQHYIFHDEIRRSSFYFSEMWVRYQEKLPNLKIWVKIFLKCPFWPVLPKLESCGAKLFVFSTDHNWWLSERLLDIRFDPLTLFG